MLILQYPKSFRALDEYVDKFNEKASSHRERLKSGAVLTAKELVRIYGISLLKASNCSTIDPMNLPSLQTNNEQLAALVKCSTRTIQRYIARLSLAGIITCKLFHGSNANYELWINPDILTINVHIAVNKHSLGSKFTHQEKLKNTAKSGTSNDPRTNCRHTYTSNTFNNILSSVENPNFENQNSRSTGIDERGRVTGNLTRNTGEIASKNFENEENSGEKIGCAGEIASRAADEDQKKLVSDASRGNSLSLYVDLFWLMARNLLYKNTDLTANQVCTAKKLIRKLYEPGEESKLQGWHEVYTQRLSLVYKFVKKDPSHRFVPLPYIFFDTNNPNGFVGTKQWYVKHLIRKKEIQCELVLSKMIRTYANNDRKDADRKKPALRMFRECENKLGKLGGQVLVDRFYAATIEHEGYRKISSA